MQTQKHFVYQKKSWNYENFEVSFHFINETLDINENFNFDSLTLEAPTPQNGQTHSNNS